MADAKRKRVCLRIRDYFRGQKWLRGATYGRPIGTEPRHCWVYDYWELYNEEADDEAFDRTECTLRVAIAVTFHYQPDVDGQTIHDVCNELLPFVLRALKRINEAENSGDLNFEIRPKASGFNPGAQATGTPLGTLIVECELSYGFPEEDPWDEESNA